MDKVIPMWSFASLVPQKATYENPWNSYDTIIPWEITYFKTRIIPWWKYAYLIWDTNIWYKHVFQTTNSIHTNGNCTITHLVSFWIFLLKLVVLFQFAWLCIPSSSWNSLFLLILPVIFDDLNQYKFISKNSRSGSLRIVACMSFSILNQQSLFFRIRKAKWSHS